MRQERELHTTCILFSRVQLVWHRVTPKVEKLAQKVDHVS